MTYQHMRQDFLHKLQRKGFFAGANEGTRMYETKLHRAEEMFELEHGWRINASAGIGLKGSSLQSGGGDQDLAARAARMYESFNMAQRKSQARIAAKNRGRGKVKPKRLHSPRAQSLPVRSKKENVSKSHGTWSSSSDSNSSGSSQPSSDNESEDEDIDSRMDSEGYIDPEDTESDEGIDDDVSISSSIGDPRNSTPGLHQVHPSADHLPNVSDLLTERVETMSRRESGLQVWHGRKDPDTVVVDDEASMDVKSFLQGRSPDFNWRLGDQIGSGAHGIVFRGLNQRTGALIAVKQIPIDGIVDASVAILLQREVDILTDMNHPHVVRYYGMEVRDNLVHLITEYVSGGSIADQLHQFGAMQEGLVCRHTRQIVVGLAFLHSHGVIHRDIKGQNILVSKQGILKLADFGAAQTFDGISGGTKHALCGTPAFVAPEIILEVGHDDRADIWSLGCTVIQMLTAETPWTPMKFGSLYELLHNVAYEDDRPPCNVDISIVLTEFLTLCFERNKVARPSAKELLRHKLLAGVDTDADSMLQRSYALNDRVKVSPSQSLDETGSIIHLQQTAAVVADKAHNNSRESPEVSPAKGDQQDSSANISDRAASIRESRLQDEGVPGMRFRKLRKPSEGCFGCIRRSTDSHLEAVVMPRGGAKTDDSGIPYARGLAAQRQRMQRRRRRKCTIS
jgi:serine/threonine protein kinase